MVLLTLLALFLIGTVVILSAVRAYFSIDSSAYILPQELGTWQEISWGADGPNSPAGWAAQHPWWNKVLPHSLGFGAGADAQGMEGADLALAVPPEPHRDNGVRPPDPNSPPEVIPRIIHQTWKEAELPPRWQAVRDECAAMHPD